MAVNILPQTLIFCSHQPCLIYKAASILVMWLWEVKELTRPRTNAFEAQPDTAAPTTVQIPKNAGNATRH